MFIGSEASCIRFRRRSCAGVSRSRRNGSVHWYSTVKPKLTGDVLAMHRSNSQLLRPSRRKEVPISSLAPT